MSKMNTDEFFQVDSTYYSYTKPFYKRLLGLKGLWSPYCGTCRKWVHIYDRMLGISVTENELSEQRYESDIVKSLLERDWSLLNTVERPPNWAISQPIIFIALGRCETCDGPFRVLGEIRGQTGGIQVLGGLFSMEIDKKSALELLETAIDRNLPANDKMYAKAVDFCKALGSSKDFAQVALARQRKEKARALGYRGMTELGNGKLDEAEANLNSALQIFEELGERKGEAMAYRSLASVYHRRKGLDHAETLVKRSLDLFEELNDKPEMAIGYGFLGQIQFDRKQFDRAELLVRKALEIDTTLGNKRGMATGYHALGAVDRALDKREQARDAYTEALKLYKELGDQALAKTMQTELDRLNP